MPASWVERGEEVVQFVTVFGVGIGFTLFLLSIFASALGLGTAGGEAINSIVGYVTTALGQLGAPLIEVALVLVIYTLAKSSGLLGGKKSE